MRRIAIGSVILPTPGCQRPTRGAVGLVQQDREAFPFPFPFQAMPHPGSVDADTTDVCR